MADAAEAHDTIERITVVGGGDAGLITALLLRRMNPEVDITVIDDFEEQIPEVGKSTISYIQNVLHNVLGIDKTRFVEEVKPIWKASVYFEDWCGCDPFHVPFDDLTLPPNEAGPRRFEELYYRYEHQNYDTLGTELTEQRKSPFVTLGTDNVQSYDHVAYHLGTSRLNDFLRTLCRERGVTLVDDEIVEVHTDGTHVQRVSSEDDEYGGDLFVDATGFSRQLVGSLDTEFEAFDFPLDSALVAKTELPLSEVVPATVINSGDAGWFWQIDTYDWRDLGYVFSSEFATVEEAAEEFAARHEGVSPEEMQHYRFEAGYFEQAWTGNCVAVGNALGFVEPLQSTALTLNALLAEKLSELLADHHHINHAGVRDIYNRFARTQWDNVYDFVSVHYRYAPADDEFWAAMNEVNDPDRLAPYVDAYHENGFNSHHEFDGSAGPTLFNQFIFYRVLRSVGLRSAFYEELDLELDEEVADAIERESRQLEHEASQHFDYTEVYDGGIFE
ncbi:MAG: tryptophan 7-halogenase [Haloarculaceae archaeon]